MVYREIKGGEGFGATSMCRRYFGLGSHAKVDSILVRWPNGAEHTFREIDAKQILLVKEDQPAFTTAK